jgi:hypothetical protein
MYRESFEINNKMFLNIRSHPGSFCLHTEIRKTIPLLKDEVSFLYISERRGWKASLSIEDDTSPRAFPSAEIWVYSSLIAKLKNVHIGN